MIQTVEETVSKLFIRLILIKVATLLIPLSINAQGFSFIDYYDAEDYTGTITVWDAVQDTNGFVYFAIGDGLTIYDGARWKHLHIGETGRGINLHYSKDHKVYASGQYDFGVLEIDSINSLYYSSISRSVYANQNRVNPHFASVETDTSIIFYGVDGYDILTSDTLIFLDDKNSGFLELFSLNNSLYSINNIGIYRLEGFSQPEVLKFDSQTIFPTYALNLNRGSVQLGFMNTSPLNFNGEKLNQAFISNKSEFVNLFPYDAIILTDSTYAVATAYDGVFIYNEKGELEEVLNQQSGLSVSGIYDLFKDHENNLWLGTSEHIHKTNLLNPINHYSNYEGQTRYFYKLTFDGKDIWAEDINERLHMSRTDSLGVIHFFSTDSSASLFQHADQSLFYNSTKGVLKNSTGRTLYEGTVFGVIKSNDPSSPIIILHENGMTRVHDSEFENLIFNNSLELDSGLEFEGEFILKQRSKGIFKLENDSLISIPIINGSGTSVVVHDLEIFQDSLYAALDGDENTSGIYVYNEDEEIFEPSDFFSNIDSELTQTPVLHLEVCSDELWLMNGFRIKRVFFENEEWKIKSAPYNQIGLDNSINSILCGLDNDVWFAGVKGLFHLTEPDWDYHTDFKTNITGVYVNNDSLIYGGFGEPVNPIVLPYEDNELRFTYAAASYIDETRNSYSVKLEGFDESWSDWSLETQKDYTNIPEGDYVFKVRSKNVFEVDGREDQILFSVLPPWYRTWWAYLLYLIGFSGLVYSAHKIRLNQLLKVERMRTKIASDLHDEVSATLTGISYFAEAVKTDQNEEKKSHFINLITESAGDAKEKITDIVWSITPENDDWSLFLAKSRRYASDLLESSGMEYTLKITDFIPGKLKMNTRQHLWMIFKEILTNAVRHSGGKRIDLILDVEDGVLKLIVQDDGNGFDISSKSFGNGVTNIRNRAEAIKAKLELDSEAEMGTRWRLELKL